MVVGVDVVVVLVDYVAGVGTGVVGVVVGDNVDEVVAALVDFVAAVAVVGVEIGNVVDEIVAVLAVLVVSVDIVLPLQAEIDIQVLDYIHLTLQG